MMDRGARIQNISLKEIFIKLSNDRPIRYSYFLISFFGAYIAADIKPKVELGQGEGQIILSVFQLIALILPAFAILLQGILQFAETPSIIIGGKGPELRYASTFIVAYSTFIMAFTVLILGRLLVLPTILDIAVVLMAIVIAGFSILPAYLASITRLDEYRDLSNAMTHLDLVARLEPVIDDPDEMIEQFFKLHDIDEWIESDKSPIDESQSKITDF